MTDWSQIWTSPPKVKQNPGKLHHHFSNWFEPLPSITISPLFLLRWAVCYLKRYKVEYSSWMFRVIKHLYPEQTMNFSGWNKSLYEHSPLVRKAPLSFPSRHFLMFDFFHPPKRSLLTLAVQLGSVNMNTLLSLSNLFRWDCLA